LRIDVTQAVARRLQFAAANILCSVENLPLQIRKIDIVKIDEADRADAGRRKIQSSRRSQTACTDAQNTRRFQTALPRWRDLGHDQMARITFPLFSAQLHRVAAFVIDRKSVV